MEAGERERKEKKEEKEEEEDGRISGSTKGYEERKTRLMSREGLVREWQGQSWSAVGAVLTRYDFSALDFPIALLASHLKWITF